MNKDRVKISFDDWAVSAQYEFLEEGKDKEELADIAAKRGIKVPCKDLAVFKCIYALVDKENKNKCTLPRKEVKKGLKTLVGKAIDKDHLRKNTLGFWLDSELEDDNIISYGAFWKGNFPEDYEIAKKNFQEGKQKISFEAWGERIFKENGSYDLTDIEFAGGALLYDTKPAFAEATVLEFSNRVLEFAHIHELDEGKKKKSTCGKCGKEIELSEKETKCPNCQEMQFTDETKSPKETKLPGEAKEEGTKDMEEAKFNFNWDNQTIARMLCETKCPSCSSVGWHDIQSIDFENSKIKSKCPNCSGINLWDLVPSVTVVKKGKKIIKATQESTVENNSTVKEGGTNVDEMVKKYQKASVEELVKYIDETIASLSVKDVELASLKKQLEESKLMIENSKIEVEKVKVEAAKIQEQLNTRVQAEKANVIKTRRDELGEEFAKSLTDEDILVDLKFENAKLRKDLTIAKSGKPVQGGLEAGSHTQDNDAEWVKTQKKIQSQAFAQE